MTRQIFVVIIIYLKYQNNMLSIKNPTKHENNEVTYKKKDKFDK